MTAPSRGAGPRAGETFERASCAGLVAGTLIGLGLTLANGLAPVQRPLTFGLALAAWASAGAVLAAWAGVAAFGLVARATRWTALRRSAVPIVVLALAAVASAEWPWRASLPAAFAATPRFAQLARPAGALAWLALAGLAFLPSRRVALRRVLAGTAVALGVAALWPVKPVVTERVPPDAVASRRPATKPAAPPLLVFGIDGGDWDFIDPLLAAGDLPALAGLRARGAWGVLKSQRPTLSPVVWTTIATGRSPRVHGVRDFVTERLRGVDAPLPELRAAGPASSLLPALLRRLGAIDPGPIRSDARRVPAFWNLATREGSPIHVVDWWATWPAERVLGAIVSERVYYRPEAQLGGARLTWPDDLARRLSRDLVRREQVTYDEARRFVDLSPQEFAALHALPAREHTLEAQLTYFCAMTETDRRVALRLTLEARRHLGQAPDLLVLFRLVDMVSHTSARFSELVDDHLGASDAERRRYGRAVSEAYRTVDRALGDLLAAFGPEANVVVVSDHGFELQVRASDGQRAWDHRNAAPGMFLAAGPAFRRGRVDGMSVLDVFPLLAELKGFPLADDLEGRPARQALGALFVAGDEPRRVATYGPREAEGGSLGAGEDPELLERLKALGYLQ